MIIMGKMGKSIHTTGLKGDHCILFSLVRCQLNLHVILLIVHHTSYYSVTPDMTRVLKETVLKVYM